MKRIIFIIISTLIAPSIFGSIFESIDSLHRFLDTNDDSIINYISKSMNNHSFCIASPIYIDTTYYAVEIQYSKEKIIGFQTIYAKRIKKDLFFGVATIIVGIRNISKVMLIRCNLIL